MIQLCDEILEFYPREIAKIGERIKRFEELADKRINFNGCCIKIWRIA